MNAPVAPVIDFDTKLPVREGYILAVAAKNPDSSEATAVTGAQIAAAAAEPPHLVVNNPPIQGDVVISAAQMTALLLSIDQLREQVLALQCGRGR